MVAVDSSALIPLAWVGRLDLVTTRFETVRTTPSVREEVLVEGKPGVAALEAFFDDVMVHESPADAERVADLEGIATADASVVLLAANREEPLLANDRGLVTVARSHGVECYWVTSLLLACANSGELGGEEAKNVLYDLVDRGMNLDPQVYVQMQRKLEAIGNE